MDTTIKAVFESSDAADFAMFRIRDAKIPVYKREIYPVEPEDDKRDIFHFAPIYSAGNADYGMHTHGMLPPISDVTGDADDKIIQDVSSDDVVLELTVPRAAKKQVISKLINSHGRGIIEN